MTMHIDEALLRRVMKLGKFETKTAAIDFALREIERRRKLLKFVANEKSKPRDWARTVDPAYDVIALRAKETPARYRTKRKSRRGPG